MFKILFVSFCVVSTFASSASVPVNKMNTPDRGTPARSDKETPNRELYRTVYNMPSFSSVSIGYDNCKVIQRKDYVHIKNELNLPDTEQSEKRILNKNLSLEMMHRLLIRQGRPWLIACTHETKNTANTADNIIVISPMSEEDYEPLTEIRNEYTTKQTSNGKPIFLYRNYGTRDEFIQKIFHLKEEWGKLNSLEVPLFYSMPVNMFDETWNEPDPHFKSSVPFTVMYVSSNVRGEPRVQVIGDIWFGYIDQENHLCTYGTTERSTMIASDFQGNGIGQQAVIATYYLLLEKWSGKKVHIINYETNESYSSSDIFDGVLSYVDFTNYQSIGNNIKSGNILIGINDSSMLMFRATNPESCTIKQIAKQCARNKQLVKYDTISKTVEMLYPSKSALLSLAEHDGATDVNQRREKRDMYINSATYQKAVNDFKEKFSSRFVIDAYSPEYPARQSRSDSDAD